MCKPQIELMPGAFRYWDNKRKEYLKDENPQEYVNHQDGQVSILWRLNSPLSRDFEREVQEYEHFIKEEWAHRYDNSGMPIYAGDIVLINEINKAVVSFYKNELQWMITYLIDIQENLSNISQPLSNFDCDENGVIQEFQIVGNIHEELKKVGL